MLRVKFISAGRLAALALFISIAVALAGYFFFRSKQPSNQQGERKLQGRVVAEFTNTRYAHEVEGRIRFLLTAGVDRTYEDGSHELEQVRLESRGTDGNRNDVLTADRAQVSDPADLEKLDAEFISNVVITIADELTIKTAYLHYDHAKATADTKELVEFDSDTLKGHSTGVTLETAKERAHLLKDVDVTISPNGSKGNDKAQGKQSKLTPEEKAARKARKQARKQAKKARQANKSQTSDSKVAKSNSAGKKSKTDKPSVKKPTRIRGETALLERQEGKVTFTGNVIVTQDKDEMRADRMTGFLDDDERIELIEARGNSYLKQEKKGEIKSPDMDFFFEEGNQLVRALATGGVQTRSLESDPLREASADRMEAIFVDGLVETINAQGNSVIMVHAPKPKDEKANPASRELKADTITAKFHPDGQNMQSAEAVGNAVMKIVPVRAEPRADRKTITAPRMNAAFFDTENRIRTFNAFDGVKVESEPMIAEEGPPRVTTSHTLDAKFFEDTQEAERLEQNGDFKYVEGDRNAVSERAVYDGNSEVLSLRGKRPMAWDAKARTQADEIDYDRRNDETHARGDVRTTYYSRESAGDSTPFKNSKSPVFMTADRADSRNKDRVAVYTGNARGWQDDNFVKGERIELYENDKRMVAVGKVESALYTTKREGAEGQETAPGFATADRMTYSDTDRLVHYDGNVKSRQGTDKLDADAIDVYLQKETNEVDKLIAVGKVMMEQPGRRGNGDRMIYTSSDGRAVLTGKSARIDDSEQGTVMGAELTFYSRDDTILVQNREGTGRVRSTHRLERNKK
jgi:lipopolysaccharide export system protein LptA